MAALPYFKQTTYLCTSLFQSCHCQILRLPTFSSTLLNYLTNNLIAIQTHSLHLLYYTMFYSLSINYFCKPDFDFQLMICSPKYQNRTLITNKWFYCVDHIAYFIEYNIRLFLFMQEATNRNVGFTQVSFRYCKKINRFKLVTNKHTFHNFLKFSQK